MRHMEIIQTCLMLVASLALSAAVSAGSTAQSYGGSVNAAELLRTHAGPGVETAVDCISENVAKAEVKIADAREVMPPGLLGAFEKSAGWLGIDIDTTTSDPESGD